MVTYLYETFTQGGTHLNTCSGVSGALGVEIGVQAQNKIGGYEHLTAVELLILQNGYPVYTWRKYYNHYMIAGKTYTFASVSDLNLPAGTYTVYSAISTDALSSSLPLAPESDSIPVV